MYSKKWPRELVRARSRASRVVSARKIERATFQEQLHASEQRLATTLKSIADAVIATDVRGRITFMNPMAESLTGWTFDEAQGRPLGDVFYVVNEEGDVYVFAAAPTFLGASAPSGSLPPRHVRSLYRLLRRRFDVLLEAGYQLDEVTGPMTAVELP